MRNKLQSPDCPQLSNVERMCTFRVLSPPESDLRDEGDGEGQGRGGGWSREMGSRRLTRPLLVVGWAHSVGQEERWGDMTESRDSGVTGHSPTHAIQ